MIKEFSVDLNKKRDLVREVKFVHHKDMLLGSIIYRLIYGVLLFLYIIITLQLLIAIINNKSDILAYLGLFLCVTSVFSFLIFIPLGIKYCLEKKYIGKWVARRHEFIHLKNNSISWMHYDKYHGSSYWKYNILYSDVKKIVYNRNEQILYVYGYMNGEEYDRNRIVRLDTIDLDRSFDIIPWMTLPAYFENFDELMHTLREKTGLDIIDV